MYLGWRLRSRAHKSPVRTGYLAIISITASLSGVYRSSLPPSLALPSRDIFIRFRMHQALDAYTITASFARKNFFDATPHHPHPRDTLNFRRCSPPPPDGPAHSWGIVPFFPYNKLPPRNFCCFFFFFTAWSPKRADLWFYGWPSLCGVSPPDLRKRKKKEEGNKWRGSYLDLAEVFLGFFFFFFFRTSSSPGTHFVFFLGAI